MGTNNMRLNGGKFEHHRIDNNLEIKKQTWKNPTGKNIKEKEHIKDLVVHIPNDLIWTK